MSAVELPTRAELAAIRAVHEMPFPAFAARFLKIRTKTQGIQPLTLNRGQLHVHEMAERQLQTRGYVRITLLKARQWGGCLSPDTPVLTADLRWVPIKDVRVGDELVSCDEQPAGSSRKMRTATVEKVWRTRKPAFRITFDDGSDVVCSADHRWLSRKSQTQAAWRSLNGRSALKVGDFVRSITERWGNSTLDDAWLGGMIDGEGSFNAHKKSGGACLKVSQCAGPVLDRMHAICEQRGYGAFDQVDNPHASMFGKRPVHSAVVASLRQLFRVLGLSRPTRFIGMRWWEGQRMPDNGWRRIVSIEPLAERHLIDIQTSTRAYIAGNGLVSHNSTYVQARYYRRVTQGPRGQRAFILTQDLKATRNIFNMTKRFHDNMDPRFRPLAPKPASTHLLFPKRDSSYGVSTAGSKATGRGDTIQFFHGSEVAFWPMAEEHLTGVMQAIPARGEGTEAILESTARGMGNAWHTQCVLARKALGEFEFCFVPWFWFDEYRAPIPPDMILSLADEEYMTLHGLDLEQMAFRYLKIIEFGGGERGTIRFMQEYPATPEEAFSADVEGSYLEAGLILKARRARVQPFGIKVMGIDPAWQGKDRFSVVCRQGRKAWKSGDWSGLRSTQSVGRVIKLIREERPAVVFVDSNGVGVGIVDPLLDMQTELGCRVIIVMGAEEADDKDLYRNKRQECWGRMKGWFEQDQGVQIEDRTGKTEAEREAKLDAWQGDLTNPLLEYDSNNRPRVESKQKMKTRKIPSPDDADALSVTFAFEVRSESVSPTPAETEVQGYKRDEDGYRRRPPPNWRAP